MISEALRRLGAVSAEYERLAREFGQVADAAARAEAEHRREKAKAVVWHKQSGAAEKISMSEAEHRADADDRVSELYLARVVTAAAADAARSQLHQKREQVAVGRSFAAAEREADRISATNPTA